MKFATGFYGRDSYSSIPTAYKDVMNGVVSQVYWGHLMGSGLYTSGAGFSPTGQPAGYAGGFTASVGSSIFTQDLVAMEGSTSGTGAMADLVADLTAVEQNMTPGAGVKIRMFSGVNSVGAAALNSPNPPPAPVWLSSSSYCGIFVDRNQQSSPPNYWVTGLALAKGVQVLSTVDGRYYTTTAALTSGASGTNTVDPAIASSHWTNNGYGPYAGPVVCWFGPSAAKYLAAYAYFQLLLANCRVWIDCPGYVNAGDSQTLGLGTGTWTAGPRPGGKDNTNSTAFTLDLCPLIQEVPHAACCTTYAEICNREIAQADGTTAQNTANLAAIQAAYLNAGYTAFQGLAAGHSIWTAGTHGAGMQSAPAPDSDVGAISNCQIAHAAAWQNTSISEAHNPFQIQQVADGTSYSSTNEPTTVYLVNQLVNNCAPGQAVPGNNSLNAAAVQLDRDIASAGGPIYFQTDSYNGANGYHAAGKTTQQIIANGQAILYPSASSTTSVGAWNFELASGFQNDFANAAALDTLWTALQGYMANGTGPVGNTDAYSPGHIRGPISSSPVINNYGSMPTSASVGVAYGSGGGGFTLTATNGPIATWTIVSGSLPPGMSLTNAGLVSGDPTAGSATPYAFTLNCTNTAGLSSQNVTLTITVATASGGPAITADDPPDTVLGADYSYLFQAGTGLSPLHGLLNIKTSETGFTNTAWRNTTCGYVPSDSGKGTQPTGTIYLSALFPTGPTLATTRIPQGGNSNSTPVAGNPIDAALAEVATWNAVSGNAQQRLKIRVSAGFHSPPWMMTSTYGGTFGQIDPSGHVSGTQQCPLFWTQQWQDEFYALMAILAAAYDENPLIAEIVTTPNMTDYPESCLRQNATSGSGVPTGGNPNMTNMLQAGYRAGDASTPYTDIWNQLAAPGIMASLWPNTIVGVTFNPYQSVDIDDVLTTSATFTHGAAPPGTLTGAIVPTGNTVASGDSILCRDALGNSIIYPADLKAAAGGTITIDPTGQTWPFPTSVGNVQVYDVQQGNTATTLAGGWSYTSNPSDSGTTAALITAAASVPNVSLENDSFRIDYVGASGAYPNMYAAMNAAAGGAVTVGIQTAQGPSIDGGSVPTVTTMATIMAAMVTGASGSSPIASHVEMFPPWSQNPDWTGSFTSTTTAALAAAALPTPPGTSGSVTWGVISSTGVSGAGLPPGLTLNSTTGALTGQTTGSAASYNFYVTVTDSLGRTTTSPLITLNVTDSGGGGGGGGGGGTGGGLLQTTVAQAMVGGVLQWVRIITAA